MNSQTALAVAAALVALAFALSTWERWLAGRRRHELAWTGALGLFGLASAFLAAGAGAGWSGAAFRGFYLFGVVNVPFLGLGTVYLLGGRRRGDRWAVAVLVITVFTAGVIVSAPFRATFSPDHLPRGSEVFGVLPRILAATLSTAGALVVFGGAAWSALRFRRTRSTRMVVANVLIAIGTAVVSASGLLNSVLDEMTAFALTLVAGITLIFAGFLVANAADRRGSTRDRGTPAIVADDPISAARAAATSRPARAAAPERT